MNCIQSAGSSSTEVEEPWQQLLSYLIAAAVIRNVPLGDRDTNRSIDLSHDSRSLQTLKKADSYENTFKINECSTETHTHCETQNLAHLYYIFIQ